MDFPMDCHDARLLLTLQRREPDQVDAAEVDALERHVELCPGCQNWNRSEARFDAAVAVAIKNVHVPVGLKNRIIARAATLRPVRRTRWIAAAAALLLAITATSAYFWFQPTAVDIEHYISQQDEEFGARPQDVQAYFASLGHSMTPPSQFDYDYLVGKKLAKRQGRMVPQLTFQRQLRAGGVVTAHVYCLSPWRFRLADDDGNIESASAHYRAQVFRGDSQIYVVVYSGGDLGMLQPSTY